MCIDIGVYCLYSSIKNMCSQSATSEVFGIQRILYEEDELGMLVAEKERQIGQQEEELRRLNQELATTQRELHSVQSTVTHREREKAVSGHLSVCGCGVCI